MLPALEGCAPTWQYVALAAVVAVQAIATAYLARRNTAEHADVKQAVEATEGRENT